MGIGESDSSKSFSNLEELLESTFTVGGMARETTEYESSEENDNQLVPKVIDRENECRQMVTRASWGISKPNPSYV